MGKSSTITINGPKTISLIDTLSENINKTTAPVTPGPAGAWWDKISQ